MAAIQLERKRKPTVIGKQDENGKWLLPAENDLPMQTIIEVIAERISKFNSDSAVVNQLDWFQNETSHKKI